MPPSDPSFAEETPENHPFCAHFRALSFGHITLTLPPSSLVTRHSLGVSHQPFLNHSIARSLNSSMTQFFSLSPRPARARLDSPGDPALCGEIPSARDRLGALRPYPSSLPAPLFTSEIAGNARGVPGGSGVGPVRSAWRDKACCPSILSRGCGCRPRNRCDRRP